MCNKSVSLHCEVRFLCVRPKLKKKKRGGKKKNCGSWGVYLFAVVRRQNISSVAHALSSSSKHVIFSYSLTWNQSGRPWLRLDLQATDHAKRLNYNNLLLISCLLTTGISYLAFVHWISEWLRSTQHTAFGNLRVTGVLNRDVSWQTCHVVSVTVLQTPVASGARVQWILHERPRRHTTLSQNVRRYQSLTFRNLCLLPSWIDRSYYCKSLTFCVRCNIKFVVQWIPVKHPALAAQTTHKTAHIK